MDDYPDNSRHQVSYNTGPPPTPASQQPSSNGAFIDSGMTDLPTQQQGSGKKIIFPFLNKAPKGFLDAISYGVDNIVMPAVNEVARRFLYSFVDYFCDQVFHTNYRYRNVWDPRYMNGRGGIDYGRFSRQNQIIRDPDDSMYYYEGSFRTNRNQHFALHAVGFLSKEDAWRCINTMKQEIRLKGAVSVDYFYDYVGRPCPGRQGWRWGWRSLEDAVPVPTNRGFRIQFPELIPID